MTGTIIIGGIFIFILIFILVPYLVYLLARSVGMGWVHGTRSALKKGEETDGKK